MKAKGQLKIPLYETQRRFVECEAPIIFLVASQGEGKTLASFVAHIYHFWRIKQKVRGLYVRDTHTNIKAMTVPSFEEAMAIIGKRGADNAEFVKHFKWHDDHHLLTHPIMEINFAGMDNVNDVNKLMGAGYSIITLEEPAPMMSGASQGIPESAFIAGVARSARQGGITTSRLQVTMNKSDEFHWTTKRMYVDPIMRPEYAPDIYTEVIEIPFGENESLSDHARQAARAAYELDPSLKARFIDNKIAFTVNGVPVAKFYSEEIHRSKDKIDPLPKVQGYRFWDQGHFPACIVCQVNPLLGRLVVLDTFVGDGIGMRQLIRGVVKPAMQTRYAKVTEWIDSGDPAIAIRDQSDIESSPLSVIEDELNTIFEPGVSDWQTRKELINTVLTESPMLLLSRHEMELHLGLRGGWAMKKLSTGQVLDMPPKGRFSHPCDALSQGLSVLIETRKPKKKPTPVISLMEKLGGAISRAGGIGRW